MASRLRSLFLIALALGNAFPALAAEPPEDKALSPIIEPEVKRREFHEARIDTEDFEVTVFGGVLSIEDFGSSPVYGARLAYHITEWLFVEGSLGLAKAGKTSLETITAPILTDDERQLTYYNANVGFNLLPGEVYPTRHVTYNSDLFLIGGVGSTRFAGADRFTFNIGLGYRLLFTDSFDLRIDFRDHIFNMDAAILGQDKTAQNLELTVGLGFFF